jgi:glycosyltransferase involved in cell wall biosynthesis
VAADEEAGRVNAMPIRVLHLRDSAWIDGPGRTILETATAVDRARLDYRMGVFVADVDAPHPFVDEARRRGLPIHAIPDTGGLSSAALDRIVALIDEHRIEVLHTSEFRSNVLGLLIRRRRPGVRLVATVHGWIANDLKGRVYRVADKVLLKLFDAAIFVSGATLGLIPRWWRPRRVHVLPNALVMSHYDGVGEARRPFAADGHVTLLGIGRLSPEKAFDTMIRAFAVLAPREPRLRLRLAGHGPLEASLKALAVELGVADRVQFLGFVKNMRPEYDAADLVVQSSITEGMPNVILEAAVLGVPILATAVGGTAEVVEHERDAWLIAPGSTDLLVDGLRRFLDDPAAFAARARAARPAVAKKFSFHARTDRLTAIYEKLIGSAP